MKKKQKQRNLKNEQAYEVIKMTYEVMKSFVRKNSLKSSTLP